MKKKKLVDIINSDLYRYCGDKSFKSFLKTFFSTPGFKYTYYLRKCSFYRENHSKIRYHFFYFILRRYSYKFCFQISPACKIGKGFYIGHFGRVIITPYAEIGSNVNISSGVIIGRTYRGKNKGAPFVGNNVWVGANSVIVGKIHIGNNVLIAPCSFVNFNVSNNAVVLGNPGKIISFKGTEGYIFHKTETI